MSPDCCDTCRVYKAARDTRQYLQRERELPDHFLVWNGEFTGWLFMKISVWQTILHILHLLYDCQPVKPFHMNCLLFSRKGIELEEFELPVLQYWSVNPVWQVQKKLPGVLVQSPCWHGWEVAHSFMSKTKQSHESKNEAVTRSQFGHIAK